MPFFTKRNLLMSLVAILLLAGCAPIREPGVLAEQATQPPTEAAAASENSQLAVDALKNATYSGIYDEPVTLTDGRYAGEPFATGDTSRPTVDYVVGAEYYADLDGDGARDAVVFLVERAGGTGAFHYVAVQLNRDGQPMDAGAMIIEDRIQVRAVDIEDGVITLAIIAPGPGDGACCPSHTVTRRYAVQDGMLAEVEASVGEPVKVSAADLDGTAWVLVELPDGQPALPDAPVTLAFAGDQLSGAGGCNTFTGSFSLGADNPFALTVGPLATTAMACDDPIQGQESAYLTALQAAGQWSYWYGKLAIYFLDDTGAYNRLLFAPAAE